MEDQNQAQNPIMSTPTPTQAENIPATQFAPDTNRMQNVEFETYTIDEFKRDCLEISPDEPLEVREWEKKDGSARGMFLTRKGGNKVVASISRGIQEAGGQASPFVVVTKVIPGPGEVDMYGKPAKPFFVLQEPTSSCVNSPVLATL